MANSLPTSSARASLSPVLILGPQCLFHPLGSLALSLHKGRCHGQTGRRWEGWKSLISGWQKQGLAYDEQTWWCSGVSALCRRNRLGLCGNCHEEMPWDESSYKLAGEVDETHDLGFVHTQPHKQGL